ncbi:hypothetical protein VZG28_05005 [Synechococcus elongatus IITB4]|uniref:hypothetical protein n=1 Tax=Synechococcus elongatus TaxID=32046 RepID=UPI0030D5391B
MGFRKALADQYDALKAGFEFINEGNGTANQSWIEGLMAQSALNLAEGYGDRLKTGGWGQIPAYALGRVAGDILTDGSRRVYWIANHPQALNSLLTEWAIGPELRSATTPRSLRHPDKEYPSVAESLIPQFVAQAAFAAANGYVNPLNLGELGRTPGFTAAVPSAEDPRKTENAAAEILSRYFMGRVGKPLEYDEFVKERPDVDLETYNEYQQFLNQDKGLLGLGLVKGTMDGLNEPEMRILGSRLSLTGATTGIGSAAGIVIGRSLNPKNRFAGATIGAALGALGGYGGGAGVNQIIQASRDSPPVVPPV